MLKKQYFWNQYYHVDSFLYCDRHHEGPRRHYYRADGSARDVTGELQRDDGVVTIRLRLIIKSLFGLYFDTTRESSETAPFRVQ